MSIRERFEQSRQAVPGTAGEAPPGQAHFELRMRMHRKLLEKVDLAALETLPQERVKAEIRNLVEHLFEEEGPIANALERQQIVRDIQHEVLGLGPLEPLLADASVSEILVNGCGNVYVERTGRLERTAVSFGSNAHLLKIIDKIVSAVGRRIDESTPMVDARLADMRP